MLPLTCRSNKADKIRTFQGFTIIELMVTIAIAGIIAAIAMPNLNEFLVRMRVDNEVSEMHRLLLTARNNAINTGLNTTVCPLDSDSICTNNWAGTISVFTNAGGEATKMDGADALIKIKEAIKPNDKLELSTAGTITYTPTGRTLTGTVNQLTYCPHGYAAESNGIDVSTSGRSYIGTKNSSNVYIDRDGNVFKCT
ncbi:MAG: prepilin-type N-terminal cleavage/methylation domain-containing protein [Colwellia sp.]|nr:prepilin-type N-terminal cleavage/methylation domain-containing protein [Colwellia sp.]